MKDLVYVHNNLYLLSRSSDEYNEEKTRMWDISGKVLNIDIGIVSDGGFTLDIGYQGRYQGYAHTLGVHITLYIIKY